MTYKQSLQCVNKMSYILQIKSLKQEALEKDSLIFEKQQKLNMLQSCLKKYYRTITDLEEEIARLVKENHVLNNSIFEIKDQVNQAQEEFAIRQIDEPEPLNTTEQNYDKVQMKDPIYITHLNDAQLDKRESKRKGKKKSIKADSFSIEGLQQIVELAQKLRRKQEGKSLTQQEINLILNLMCNNCIAMIILM